MSVKVCLILLCAIAATTAYGTSYTKLSKPHQSWFDYEISHSKHGSWHGGAHPHGYGGLGDSHGRFKRSAHGGWSKTYFSKPHQGKFEYDVDHDKHGSWHGSSHPDGYGGLGDGTGSYRLGGHSKVIGALPQGGGHGIWKRSADESGWSKTSFSKPHQGKFDYDIEHSKHGSWHGSAHPDGYGGLGDGTGSYRLGGHSKVIGALPQGGSGSRGSYKRSAAVGGWSKTSVSRPHSDKYNYDIEHKYHGDWHGFSHPHGYGGL